MPLIKNSPLWQALGYGWTCPYCHVEQAEENKTGTYYFGKSVCGRCAPVLSALRKAAED